VNALSQDKAIAVRIDMLALIVVLVQSLPLNVGAHLVLVLIRLFSMSGLIPVYIN